MYSHFLEVNKPSPEPFRDVAIRYHEERHQVPTSFADLLKSFNLGFKHNKMRNIKIKSLLVVWETLLPECSLPEKTLFTQTKEKSLVNCKTI